MANKEKELLTKDLCSRLDNHSLLAKYGEEDYNIIGISFGRVILVKPLMSMTSGSPLIEEVKPYLRPMSNMTEEEKDELKEYLDAEVVDCNGFGYSEGGTLEDYTSSIPYSLCSYIVDWLNKKMFDYRGLIPMGLALEAPDGMYKNI